MERDIHSDIEGVIAEVYEEFGTQLERHVRRLREHGHPELADRMQRLMHGVFCNDPLHTLRRGNIYLIGLNPVVGVHDLIQDIGNVESLAWWRSQSQQSGRPYSAYIDKDCGSGAGRTPHQSNVREVLHAVMGGESEEQDTRGAFATNLCFYRTLATTDLYDYPDWQAMVGECWTFHLRFLSIIRPRLILCNGNGELFSAFSEIKKHFGIGAYQSEPVHCRRSLKWFCGTLPVDGGGEVLVVGLPHLSQPYGSFDGICAAIRRIRATLGE